MSNSAGWVLIVDDSEAQRYLIQHYLSQSGFAAQMAANGAEALDVLSKSPRPLAIILDLKMPIMSGWEFLDRQKLDASMASIPVVVFTDDKEVTEKHFADTSVVGIVAKDSTAKLVLMVKKAAGVKTVTV